MTRSCAAVRSRRRMPPPAGYRARAATVVSTPSAALAMARPTELEGRLLAVLARGRVARSGTGNPVGDCDNGRGHHHGGPGRHAVEHGDNTRGPTCIIRAPAKDSSGSVFAQDGQLPAERLAAERAVKQSSGALDVGRCTNPRAGGHGDSRDRTTRRPSGPSKQHSLMPVRMCARRPRSASA